jgi:iron complex outermembrane receptor protein
VNTTTNSAGYRIEARGFNNGTETSSSLLVLVDGRRVNEPGSGQPDWALIDLDYVERIEIVRGPTSVLHGDNAIGGVVQIFTRRVEGAPRFTLRGRSGTFDLDAATLLAGGSLGPVGLTLFAHGLGEDGFRDRADFQARGADVKLHWAPSQRWSAELAAGLSSDEREDPGALTPIAIDRMGRDAAEPFPRVDQDVRHRYAQIVLEGTPADGMRARLRTFYRSRHDQIDTVLRLPFSRSTIRSVDQETRAEGLNARLEIDRRIASYRNRMVVGADWLREKLEPDVEWAFLGISRPPSFYELRGRRRIYGVFIRDELSVTRTLLLSGGARLDHVRYKESGGRGGPGFSPPLSPHSLDLVSPEVALTYRIAQPLAAYASFSRGFRFPTFEEAFGWVNLFPVGAKRQTLQRSSSYEAGVKLRGERVAADIAVYRMDVADELVGASGFLSQHLDRIRHSGVEVSLWTRPLERVEISGSYTLDHTEVRRSDPFEFFEGRQVPITPRHRGSIGVSVELPLELEIRFLGRFVGSRFLAMDFWNFFEKLPKYAVYDAVVRFEPPLGDWLELTLEGAVRNLFDREYEEFGTASFDIERIPFPQPRLHPAPGRSYEVGITLSVQWPSARRGAVGPDGDS